MKQRPSPRRRPKPVENGQKSQQLSGEELGALAERLVKARSAHKIKAIQDEMVRGFYGRP